MSQGALFLLDHGVPLLEGADVALAVFLDVGDAFGSSACSRDRRDVRDAVLDGCLPQVGVIVDGLFAGGGVDDKVDVAVRHEVEDVRTAFIEFQDFLGLDAGGIDGVAGGAGGDDLEAGFIEELRDFDDLVLVLAVDGDEDRAFEGQGGRCAFLSFEERAARGPGDAEDFAGGPHFGAEDRVDFLEHLEGEDRFLDTVVRDVALAELGDGRFTAGQFGSDDVGGDGHHGDAADLGDQRDRTGRTRVGFEDIDDTVLDGVLHVHEADDVHLFGDLSRVVLDGLKGVLRNVLVVMLEMVLKTM